MDENRNFRTLLKEAELLASSPEVVANWLQSHNRWSASEPSDDSLEANLLARRERLIDLALARYGQCEAVLQELFARDDQILRASVLSNENAYQSSIFDIVPFRDRELSWISELSQIELEALFSNPALPNYQIKQFFDMKGAWLALNESQRETAAIQLIGNIRKWTDTFSLADSSTWESTRLDAVQSVWKFSEKIHITPPWPYWLGRLYLSLGVPSYIGFDPLQAASRWSDPQDQEKAIKENANGFLTTYQQVRCGLGRLSATEALYDKEKLKSLLEHGDVAIRCGAYLVAALSAEEINAVSKKDGKLACAHLIENEKVWRREETRDALQEACKRASKGQDWIVSLSADFSRRCDHMEKVHPDWFERKNWTDDEVEEKPLTESSIGELVERVAASETFILMEKGLEMQSKAGTIRFWTLLVLLGIIALQI